MHVPTRLDMSVYKVAILPQTISTNLPKLLQLTLALLQQ